MDDIALLNLPILKSYFIMSFNLKLFSHLVLSFKDQKEVTLFYFFNYELFSTSF